MALGRVCLVLYLLSLVSVAYNPNFANVSDNVTVGNLPQKTVDGFVFGFKDSSNLSNLIVAFVCFLIVYGLWGLWRK